MTRETSDGEGFLQRWSRRKRGETDDAEAASLEASEPAILDPQAEAMASDAPENPELVANREAAEAVDLDSLVYESDFTVFMKKGVPTELKNAALRKLWRSNPVLAVVDGLNDYDEDFRVAEGALEHFQSAWKVGKGYADKAEEVAAEMEEKSARLADARQHLASGETPDLETDEEAKQHVSPEEDDELAPADKPGDVEELPLSDHAEGQRAVESTEDTAELESPLQKVPIRRRMSFSTD
ncbi:DUF3306 domain-containing protein [Labrenzia sp. CE80]|uniref:DUF3306 domain-containing protein n=1 Tax=Labrenzia sp. CE80 TaxID=1788986 RepID=UPI00129A37A6|nr:DUF3306 domain-containing protein [Labrenzia sp. CE80]